MTDLFSNIVYPFINNSLILNTFSSFNFDTLIIQFYPIKPFDIIKKVGIREIDNLFLIYLLFAATYQTNLNFSITSQISVQNTTILPDELKKHIISKIKDDTILLTFDDMPITLDSNIKFSNVFTDIEFNEVQDNLNHIFLKIKDAIEVNMKYLFDDFQNINFNFKLNQFNASDQIFTLLNYFLSLSRV